MQICHRRLNIGTFHSLDLGAKINTAMKRNAEKKKKTKRFFKRRLLRARSLHGRSQAHLGQVSEGNLLGTVFSGFWPSILLSDGHGSWQRRCCQQEALPALTHQVFFPSATSAGQGVAQPGHWDGQGGVALFPAVQVSTDGI